MNIEKKIAVDALQVEYKRVVERYTNTFCARIDACPGDCYWSGGLFVVADYYSFTFDNIKFFVEHDYPAKYIFRYWEMIFNEHIQTQFSGNRQAGIRKVSLFMKFADNSEITTLASKVLELRRNRKNTLLNFKNWCKIEEDWDNFKKRIP